MSEGNSRELAITIQSFIECPACECLGGEWEAYRSIKRIGLTIQGSAKCQGCGKFFSFTRYEDGQFHCSMRRKRK